MNTQTINWAEIWELDHRAMIDTMIENMTADLKAGYSPTGTSILRQLFELASYKEHGETVRAKLAAMTEPEKNRWCHRDLKNRGVIA